MDRLETGAVRFGEDWPGVFLRGDDCFGLALTIEDTLREIKRLPGFNPLHVSYLEGLLKTLKASNLHLNPEAVVQTLKPIKECLP